MSKSVAILAQAICASRRGRPPHPCPCPCLRLTYLFRLASSGNLLGGFNNSAATVLQRLLQRLEPTVILGCCSGLDALGSSFSVSEPLSGALHLGCLFGDLVPESRAAALPLLRRRACALLAAILALSSRDRQLRFSNCMR